jgi:hypothetical protein
LRYLDDYLHKEGIPWVHLFATIYSLAGDDKKSS